MMFHTIPFILGFLPVCLVGFFALGRFGSIPLALGWLVACSLFFYAWWNPEHLPLLVGSISVNYAIAIRLRSSSRHRLAWLTAGIAVNLMILAWFKYAGFLWHIVTPGAHSPQIILPLAVSFFTFQQIMFLVDTAATRARGHAAACLERPCVADFSAPAFSDATVPALIPAIPSHQQPPLLNYAAFVTFFPHLIAGPIVRPSEIIPQLADPGLARPRIENITDGLLIFLLGLGKKLVLADMFGGFADIGFDAAAHGATLTFFEAWYAALAYALEIYFDFSGYSGIMYQPPPHATTQHTCQLTAFEGG